MANLKLRLEQKRNHTHSRRLNLIKSTSQKQS